MSAPCLRCAGTGKEPDHTALGLRVRAAREAKGLGLRELADMVGCSPAYVCDVEYGRRGGGFGGAKTRRLFALLGVKP